MRKDDAFIGKEARRAGRGGGGGVAGGVWGAWKNTGASTLDLKEHHLLKLLFLCGN